MTPRHRWKLLMLWTRRLSLRARIALAFTILILSSASCTILIGNGIFGRKAEDLARTRLDLDLEVLEQVLRTRQEAHRTLAEALWPQVRERGLGEELCRFGQGTIPVDFFAVLAPDGLEVLGASPCRGEHHDGPGLLLPEVADFATLANVRGRCESGLVTLTGETLTLLGHPHPPAQGLGALTLCPMGDGRTFALGTLTEAAVGLLGTTLDRFAAHGKTTYKTSIFIGDRRVATTLGEGALGSTAAPEVVEAVLGRGEVFIGPTTVAGVEMDAAYVPLEDYRGRVVGMLGIGTDDDVYGEIRGRTATLFSTIIAAGMGFGFLMSWFLSFTLIRPLRDLANGLDRVAGGDLDLKVRIDSKDELGQVSRAFNLMVQAVKERDMRLREVTQEKLSQVERQVSVGRLAAGVAHEINNPLTAILSLSLLVQKSLPKDDPRWEDLDVVVTETTRCRDIVRSLLDFARERPPEKRVVDINTVIRDTLNLVSRYDSLSAVEVQVCLAEVPLRVNADPKHLQQVFANLVLNAAEAMRASGRVRVATDEDSSGGFVVVTVEDNGRGIAPEHLGRVFEPFFTTKGSGKGTGLGLSVSLGIIQRHEGTIDITSREGEGTLVTVTLPRAIGEN